MRDSGLHQHEVEVVAMNGGGMRGKQCYKPGNFTLGDLYKELAFDEVSRLRLDSHSKRFCLE